MKWAYHWKEYYEQADSTEYIPLTGMDVRISAHHKI